MRDFSSSWAQGLVNSKESHAAKIFINGGFTAGHAVFNQSTAGRVDPQGDFIYTGKPFFALTGNNHPAKDGSTYFNSLGALSLTSTNLQTSYNQMTNTNNVTQNLVTPIEWQYLTDTNGWFLGKRNKGVRWIERQSPVIDFYQNDVNKNWYATIDARFGATVVDWRYWNAANISTS